MTSEYSAREVGHFVRRGCSIIIVSLKVMFFLPMLMLMSMFMLMSFRIFNSIPGEF